MNVSKFKKYSLEDLFIIGSFLQDYCNYSSLFAMQEDVRREIEFRVNDF